jgi:hypothetical protein
MINRLRKKLLKQYPSQ